jgi:DNA (cytosine-5)-methyltransferase 1
MQQSPGMGGQWITSDSERIGHAQCQHEGQSRSEEKLFKGRCIDATDSDSEVLEHRNGQGKARRGADSKKRTKSFDSPRGWENFPTQSPICRGDDGLPTELDGITFSKWRNESIKAYGNAVVPQVVYQIFKAIHTYEGVNNRTA